MRIASLLLALPILAASCGGSSDPAELTKAGESELGNQESAAAAENFDAALKAIGGDTAHPMYVRAKLGLAEAYTASAPDKSKEIVAALLKEVPGKLSVKDVKLVMNEMATSKAEGALSIAGETLTLALAAFPEAKADLDTFGEFLAKQAQLTGDAEAASALDSLGYTGGD